jgi:UDP-N-acetylmuramoylalanine--D-glutamate ligase
MEKYSIVVLGGGESGVGAALLAKNKGLNVFLSDGGMLAEKYRRILAENSIPFEENNHSPDIIFAAETLIKSPGIPEKNQLIIEARKKNIEIISEIEFAARYTSKKIVAITGTNGKTTTTLLTHHLLNGEGRRVALAGNIGKSFAAAVLNDAETDLYVLEISSFQLDDIKFFKPHIAILLNITPDHLDRYDYSMEKYAQAKYRIAENQDENDFFIGNAADPYSHTPVKAKKINLDTVNFAGENVRIDNKKLIVGQLAPIDLENLPLKGRHNMLNMCAALTVANIFRLHEEYLREKLRTFVNAPHRLQLSGTVKGVKYINDSKATNVDAVSYALDAFEEKLVWIAGGTDKGNDYSLIEAAVKKNVRVLICLGADNNKIFNFFSDKVSKIFDTNSMQEALGIACEEARVGEIVLLSPACASFDLFKNYEHRGEMFMREVTLSAEKWGK